ncbi:MAG: ABC transporter permease [Terriglobia bacterium]
MFLRLVRRGLWEQRSRALVALTALTVGATLTAALLNLYLDSQRKLRSEFRRYGANLMLTPRAAAPAGASASLLPAELARQLARDSQSELAAVVPYLYAVVEAADESVVLAGIWLGEFARLGGFEVEAGTAPASPPVELSPDAAELAWVGTAVARRFQLKPGDSLAVRYQNAQRTFRIAGIVATGAAEDNQILAELEAVQRLTGSPDGLNAILARATGEPAAIEQTARRLAARFPTAAVNPLRQVTQAEFRVVERIRGSLVGTTLVVLVVIGLGVLATMTAVAYARRSTLGTLKALGASNARLYAVFLTEAAVLALVASGIGFVAGVGLAGWLGKTLFAASVTLRWTTLPLVTAVSLALALAGTLLPLRLVRRTQPAVILRGE